MRTERNYRKHSFSKTFWTKNSLWLFLNFSSQSMKHLHPTLLKLVVLKAKFKMKVWFNKFHYSISISILLQNNIYRYLIAQTSEYAENCSITRCVSKQLSWIVLKVEHYNVGFLWNKGVLTFCGLCTSTFFRIFRCCEEYRKWFIR